MQSTNIALGRNGNQRTKQFSFSSLKKNVNVQLIGNSEVYELKERGMKTITKTQRLTQVNRPPRLWHIAAQTTN